MRTVIVGAGAAGLWCGLHAAPRGSVIVVAPEDGAATAWAQGGIAAAMADGDDPASHEIDTLGAGGDLCDPRAVEILVREAPESVAELKALGMVFDDGGPTREGGHTVARVWHAGGDATGSGLLETIERAVVAEARVRRVHGRAVAILLDGSRAAGVALDDGSELEGDRVVLATGGACGIFGRRTGPEEAAGRGLAMAWDAGASLADLEFVQFHPTALDVPGHPARLLTEALRGEGAVLIDGTSRRFMLDVHPMAELAPRDIVARAIAAVREETRGPVFLDASGIRDVERRFPVATAQCREVGLDIAREHVPVAPAAHYFTGGVLTDVWGQTTVEGLLACGEVASTGVHGANRLASNSLAEALVFGRRAGIAPPGAMTLPGIGEREPAAERPSVGVPLDEVRAVADRLLGVVRSGSGLTEAVQRLGSGAGRSDGDRDASLVASLLATAALRREESRGGHFRSDFPETSPAWRLRQVVDRTGWRRVSVGSLHAPAPVA